MIKLSAPLYYFQTLLSLLIYTSWWKIPLIFLEKPLKYSIPLNLQFYVSNLMDIWTLQEVIIDQHYERVKTIPCEGVVIDIGGSIGDFSTFASKIRKASIVHSYELNPERITLFKKNLDLNNVNRVVLHEKPALSLSKVFQECKIKHCDFMKVDCEGAEYQIFSKTPVDILKKIKSISFEVHFFTTQMKEEYPVLKSTLAKSGFTLIEQANPVHRSIGFLYAYRQ